MTRNHLAIISLGAAIVLVSACGRQPSANITDGGGTVYDIGGGGEGFIPLDSGPDMPPPCTPDCGKICEMQRDCGMIGPGEVNQCEKDCQANPKEPALVCMAQLVCAPTPDCNAAKQCKADPKAPDLKVSHSAQSFGTGSISYTGKVCNVGTGDAPASTVHFYRNLTAAPKAGQKGDRVVKVSALKAGVCVSVQETDNNLASGTYSTWAQADAENVVAETDETNNTSGPIAVTIKGTPTDKPDLVVANMLVQVSSTAGTAAYDVSVCNNGKGASGATSVAIYVDSPTKPTPSTPGNTIINVPALAAAACTTLQYKASLTSGKTYQSWAYVDFSNQIVETVESNNTFGPVKFTVGGTTKLPDMVVTSMTVTTSATTGTFTIKICNQGTAASGQTSYLWLYANRATAPTSATKANKVLGVASMAPAACKTAVWVVPGKAGNSYKAWALADPQNLIAESSESNNVYGPVSWSLAATKKPDLTVSSLAAASSSTGVVTYKVQACNNGAAAAAGTFYVGFYANLSSAPTATTAATGTVAIAGLGIGACKTISYNTTLKAGTYASWAFADYKNLISESNEANNYVGPTKVVVNTTVPKPDLQISTVSVSQTSYSYTRYDVTVCNKGSVSASYSNLELYLNRASKPTASTPGNLTSYVNTLAPGACYNRTFNTILSPGTYTSWLYVDRTDAVDETNETNNTYGPVKVVVPGTGKPDLQVINVSTSQANGYVYYYMTVCNKGTATSGNTSLDLYYNLASKPTGATPGNITTTMQSLTQGACTTRTGYTTLPGGTYKSWVYVDRENIVLESAEANNTYGPVTVTVTGTGKPDLQITNVSTSPYSSGYTMYYVTVCNKGNATAGYARIDLYYNRATKPTVTDVGERYTSTSTLTAGACTTRNIYAQLATGTYNSWLWVDRTNAVLESKEANNMYGPLKVTVGSTGTADLIVSSLTGSADASGTVVYYANVCNNGYGASTATTVDIYYNSTYPPSAGTKGDTYASVPALASQTCTSVGVKAQLKNGTYYSWAYADRTNTVKETNENNNYRGPTTIIVGGTTTNYCTTVCAYLVNPCKYIPSTQLQACTLACQAQPQSKQLCAYQAAQKGSCSGIISCL